MLRHRAAPAYPHHVDRLDAEPVEQQPRDARHQEGVIGHARIGRAADAGHVEGDERPFLEQIGKGGHRLHVRADAVEEQERGLAQPLVEPPARDAQRAAVGLLHGDFGPGGSGVFELGGQEEFRSVRVSSVRSSPLRGGFEGLTPVHTGRARVPARDASCCRSRSGRPSCRPTVPGPIPSSKATSCP